MKYAINQLEAVRGYYDAMGAKPRIRYYANGKEVSKTLAVEFTVSGVTAIYTAPVAVKKERKESGKTKAAQLRAEIQEAVASGEFDFDSFVDWTQEQFGFTRPLARQYVKNNLVKA
jgi:hypothetical protein